MSVVAVALGDGGRVAPEVCARVRDEPGLGAVVVPGVAVVVHERLLAWCPRDRFPDEGSWLRSLQQRLEGKAYRVEDAQGWALPPVPVPGGPRARARRLVRTPLHVRVRDVRRRWRRTAFLVRLRWEAWLVGCDLALAVSRDLLVEPGVRLQLRPGKARLEVGPRCSLGAGVILRLGGELVLGPNVDVRHDVGINVKGRLELQGRNVLARGAMVHADDTLVFEWGAMAAEYSSVLDSDHEFDGSHVHVLDQGVLVRQVRIGAGALVGAHSTVRPGVHIGRRSIVGAGSVVVRDVPDGTVAVGAPARPVRALPEPS